MSVAVKKGAILAQPSGMSLSLLPGDVIQNGPERSRARRCWTRRSGPLTARTVLRGWKERERRGEELAKDGAKKWPLRSAATDTRIRRTEVRLIWSWRAI